MNQNDLNRAVARATGETMARIDHMGFQFHTVLDRQPKRHRRRRHRRWRGQKQLCQIA